MMFQLDAFCPNLKPQCTTVIKDQNTPKFWIIVQSFQVFLKLVGARQPRRWRWPAGVGSVGHKGRTGDLQPNKSQGNLRAQIPGSLHCHPCPSLVYPVITQPTLTVWVFYCNIVFHTSWNLVVSEYSNTTKMRCGIIQHKGLLNWWIPAWILSMFRFWGFSLPPEKWHLDHMTKSKVLGRKLQQCALIFRF